MTSKVQTASLSTFAPTLTQYSIYTDMADQFNWQDRVVVVTGSGGETERLTDMRGTALMLVASHRRWSGTCVRFLTAY